MSDTGSSLLLEGVARPCEISEFRGATVVIDTYYWLRNGAETCALQLARGETTKTYIDYCLIYVKMLQIYNIKPILVFNGRNLPAKAGTEAKRVEARNRAKLRAAELLRIGKTQEALPYLKQSISITPEMVSAVIKACRKLNVDCIVAPYECGAQMAYFTLNGIAELVISEDFSSLLFGCSKVMFKLDLCGVGCLVETGNIPEAMKLRPEVDSLDMFRYMCILSGCDYISSFKGIGIENAMKFIKIINETNPEIFLDYVPLYLNIEHLQITNQYKKDFLMANAIFLHQIVFDPFKRQLVPLRDPAVCGTDLKHCKRIGEMFDHELAYEIVVGNLHPTTLEQLDDWAPSEADIPHSSIWSSHYKNGVQDQFNQSSSSKAKADVNIFEQTKIDAQTKPAKALKFQSQECSDLQKPSTSKAMKVLQKNPPVQIIELSDEEDVPNNGNTEKFDDESDSDELVENVDTESDGSSSKYCLAQKEANSDESEDEVYVISDESESSDEETEVITTGKLKLNFSQKVSIEKSSSERTDMGAYTSVKHRQSKREKRIRGSLRKDSTSIESSRKKRKMEKALRKFLQANVDSDVNLVHSAQTNIDEVRKLAKELTYYSQKYLNRHKASTSSSADVPSSPTNYSKFHRTDTNTQIIVKRRYVTSKSEEMDEESKVKKESKKVQLSVKLVQSRTETEAEDSSTEFNRVVQNQTNTEELELDFSQEFTIESSSSKKADKKK